MNHSAKAVIVIGVIAGAVLSTLVMKNTFQAGRELAQAKTVSREFACYSDGKLVERHVSVGGAYKGKYNEWLIVYTDGNQSTYVQDAGESCQLEEYTPDANSTEG